VQHFLDISAGPHSNAHQRRRGSYDGFRAWTSGPATERLGPDEIEFLESRDSFYLASVGEDGWPYVQHRGGPVGFVRVLGGTTLAWAERPGNRQFLTAGHVDADSRVALIAVDYPTRTRLKVLGRADWQPAPDPVRLDELGLEGRAEGLMTVEVVAVDWNCPKYITPRFTAEQVAAVVEPLRRRIDELEAQLAAAV
jgi:uncharacterized protein